MIAQGHVVPKWSALKVLTTPCQVAPQVKKGCVYALINPLPSTAPQFQGETAPSTPPSLATVLTAFQVGPMESSAARARNLSRLAQF